MTAFEDLRVSQDGGVVWVEIHRPHVRNAYRTRTCHELVDVIEGFVANDAARVLVLTGAGGSFCSGGDLSHTAEVEEADRRQLGHGAIMREGMHRVIRALWSCDKPTVALVDGPAVSGGLALALCCDLRIGSARTRMGDVSGRVGLLPDEGGAWIFPRVLGQDRALQMTLLQQIYDADQCVALGLLHETVAMEDLHAHVTALAQRLAAGPPLAMRTAKRMIRDAEQLNLDQALRQAELAVEVVNISEDVQEGIRAFLDKRPPRFVGR